MDRNEETAGLDWLSTQILGAASHRSYIYITDIYDLHVIRVSKAFLHLQFPISFSIS